MALDPNHTILSAENKTTGKVDIQHLTRGKTQRWRSREDIIQLLLIGSVMWLGLTGVDTLECCVMFSILIICNVLSLAHLCSSSYADDCYRTNESE